MRELSGILRRKLYKAMQCYPRSEEYENKFFINLSISFKASTSNGKQWNYSITGRGKFNPI